MALMIKVTSFYYGTVYFLFRYSSGSRDIWQLTALQRHTLWSYRSKTPIASDNCVMNESPKLYYRLILYRQ